MLFVCMGASCCKASPPKTTPAATTIQTASENVFAEQDLGASPAMSTAFSTHATSLSKSALDAEVVERVVRARLKEATREALEDLFDKAGRSATSKPARDLIVTIASLMADASDGEARSQTLVASLVRNGFAAWIAKIGGEDLIEGGAGCKESGDDSILDAAYEGLAASQYLRPLGFPKSNGEFASDDCAKFGGEVAMLVDAVARFPDVSTAAVNDLTKAVDVVTVSTKSGACRNALTALPVEVKVALNNVDPSDVGTLRNLYEAGKVARSVAATISPTSALRGDLRECAETLLAFTDQFERTLMRFSADVSGKVDVSKIKSMLARIEKIVAAINKKYSTQLAAAKSILMRLVDGRSLRRGDVVMLVQFIGEALRPSLEKLQPDLASEIIVEVVDVLPEAVREDVAAPAGIRMDVASIASTVVGELSRETRAGWYLRATVGTGYVMFAGEGSREPDVATSVHEEMGFGYRWLWGPVLHGPHVIASGILFSFIEQDATSDRLFFGIGYSANMYRLVDVSLSIGRMIDPDGTADDTAGVVGLQIPLFDYLSALTSGGDIAQDTEVGGK
jgi:hypothetical protein